MRSERKKRYNDCGPFVYFFHHHNIIMCVCLYDFLVVDLVAREQRVTPLLFEHNARCMKLTLLHMRVKSQSKLRIRQT